MLDSRREHEELQARLEALADDEARLFVAGTTEVLCPFFDAYLSRNGLDPRAHEAVMEGIAHLWAAPDSIGPESLVAELREHRPLLEGDSPLELLMWGYQELELLVAALGSGPVGPTARQAFIQANGTFTALARPRPPEVRPFEEAKAFPPLAQLQEFGMESLETVIGGLGSGRTAELRQQSKRVADNLFAQVEDLVPPPRSGYIEWRHPVTGERMSTPR